MQEIVPQAFISCRFAPEEVVHAICNLFSPEIECRIATDLKLRPIPSEILSRIKNADLLVAIITSQGDSSWIQNELGMAYALNKPTLVFYEAGVSISGFAPMVSEYVGFDRQNLAALVNDKRRLVSSICAEVLVQRQEREQLNSLEEQKRLGVVGIYPDRKEAFAAFRDFWDLEKYGIALVTSTLEGFRKFAGGIGREMIEDKLRSGCNIRILFTHPDYLHFRAANENVEEESIRQQLFESLSQIEPLLRSGKTKRKSTGLLEARWFQNPPTCFTVSTQSYMLLNPYPYMRTAYTSFAVIVRKTERRDDIFNVFREFHFQRAWDRSEPVKFK